MQRKLAKAIRLTTNFIHLTGFTLRFQPSCDKDVVQAALRSA
jgi:hypothetical protein